MDQIRGRLEFVHAEIESLTFVPAERDPTASLVLSADFSPEIAAVMKCRETFYSPEEKPYFGPTRVDLGDKKLRDIELTLPMADNEGQWDTYVPESIGTFKVDRDAEDAPVLRLHMRVRIQGRYEELAAFLRATNKDSFTFSIRSRQTEFDWSGATSGTQVEMGGAAGSKVAGKAEGNGPLFQQPELAPCGFCDREIPRNEDGLHLADGGPFPCPRPVPPSEVDDPTTSKPGPVLASRNDMGIRKPKLRTPRPSAEAIDANNGLSDEQPVFPVN
jgi:hypothetical protein